MCRMSRDQRMRDNWALLYALEKAAEQEAPCAVAFNLVGAESASVQETCSTTVGNSRQTAVFQCVTLKDSLLV